MRRQATKATPNEVSMHIARQRELGELMINDVDAPRPIELALTLVAVALTLADMKYHWWSMLCAWLEAA